MRCARHFFPALALAASVLIGPAALAAPPLKTADGILVDAKGMTVYTFDKDAPGSGKSACNGPCAQAWPPVAAQASDQDEGDYAVITRDDGTRQWAYKGQPLYLFDKDANPGDKNGDNFKEVWHVVKP
ncbi:hypothetical protein FOZ76_19025 [Verticiella sediminum]|uniref:ATP-binding protein n=1 Tax=Verticiella sediminum TaxID=1247510 RepID=A0A556AED3_9BURK|nr:hypothetical protein [Verticiella sediminum]TSH91239.1 hypothetical protein FOZ76_19025 [Verticiella sediminum]